MGHWYLSATSGGAHKKAQTLSNMDGFLLLRKMSSFFPSSVRANERKIKFTLLKQIQLHAVMKSFGVITYSVDAAASGGPCSTGNNSQTPSRCILALTLGWMGPCCQSPSNKTNTGNWKLFFFCNIGEISVPHEPTLIFSVKEPKWARSVEPWIYLLAHLS